MGGSGGRVSLLTFSLSFFKLSPFPAQPLSDRSPTDACPTRLTRLDWRVRMVCACFFFFVVFFSLRRMRPGLGDAGAVPLLRAVPSSAVQVPRTGMCVGRVCS